MEMVKFFPSVLGVRVINQPNIIEMLLSRGRADERRWWVPAIDDGAAVRWGPVGAGLVGRAGLSPIVKFGIKHGSLSGK
jgi:hypothetical protein